MKTLNTGVTTQERLNKIEVNSPYWVEPANELTLTDKQMTKLQICFAVILWVFNLVLALTLLNR